MQREFAIEEFRGTDQEPAMIQELLWVLTAICWLRSDWGTRCRSGTWPPRHCEERCSSSPNLGEISALQAPTFAETDDRRIRE
ncbi:MAG: hypothetical protein ACYDC1_08830 [Limisphaerales bacterium]